MPTFYVVIKNAKRQQKLTLDNMEFECTYNMYKTNHVVKNGFNS